MYLIFLTISSGCFTDVLASLVIWECGIVRLKMIGFLRHRSLPSCTKKGKLLYWTCFVSNAVVSQILSGLLGDEMQNNILSWNKNYGRSSYRHNICSFILLYFSWAKQTKLSHTFLYLVLFLWPVPVLSNIMWKEDTLAISKTSPLNFVILP